MLLAMLIAYGIAFLIAALILFSVFHINPRDPRDDDDQ